jgi:hypothetical protein
VNESAQSSYTGNGKRLILHVPLVRNDEVVGWSRLAPHPIPNMLVFSYLGASERTTRPATIAMRGGGPQMTNVGSVVKLLQKEHDRLTKQIRGIAAALEAFGATYGKQNGTRKISAAGRARIAAAQRARWAKARASNGANSPTKRKMSRAAKARIAAAQRARWAKVRTATRKAAA